MYKRQEREKALFNLYQLEKNREVKKAKIESRIKEKDEERVKIESIEKNIKEEEKFLTEKREQLSQIFAVLRWEDDRFPEEAFSDCLLYTSWLDYGADRVSVQGTRSQRDLG